MMVKWKDIVLGRNPRKYFDPDYQRSLEDSMRAQGLLQIAPCAHAPRRYL